MTSRVTHFKVKRIIWNGRSWRPSTGWSVYTGSNPHKDHLHVEIEHSASEFGNRRPRCANGPAGCYTDCSATTEFLKYLGGPKYLNRFTRIPVPCWNWGSHYCRTVKGTSSWSAHAYGTAVDLGVGWNQITRGNAVLKWLFASMSATSPKWPGVYFRKGMTDKRMLPFFQRLRKIRPSWGFFTASSPVFGSGKDRAVRRFQKQKGLQPDGVVGPRTWRAAWS